MAKAKKATIKFQKNKLKPTIERRKKNNKYKQQLAQRKNRRGKEYGKETKETTEEDKEKPVEEEEAKSEPEVNVEDYFCEFSINGEELLDLEADEEQDLNALDAFKEVENTDVDMDAQDDEDADNSDEEEMNDEFEESEESESEDEDEENDDMEEDDSQVVTREMLEEWSAAADKKSPEAFKKMLMAFRAIARSDEDTEIQYTYRVNSNKVYNKLVKKTISAAYPFFSQHILINKKVKHPAKTRDWPKLERVIHLFLNNSVRFLRDLDQDDMVGYFVKHLDPCAPYFGCFPKTAREYLRVLLDRWSDVALSSDTRAQCFKAIRNFAATAVDLEKRSYLPLTLKGVYLTFAKHATKINETSLPLIQQMIEEGADVFTVDPKISLQHADVYIRQLATHLKKAKKAQTVESFKTIYTWQFVSCLDFWAAVIGATCDPETGSSSPMQAMVQPLVDMSLHTLRLNPTAQFLPLRIHIIRSLIGMCDSTGYYIPLAPLLFDIFGHEIFKTRVDNSEVEPFEWELYLKTPKTYMNTKVYQDAVYKVLYDSLIDFFACFGLSIAFPELAIPAIDKLKEQQNKMKGTRFTKSLRVLIEKLETHKNYIEQKRAPIEYGPNKMDEALSFLRNTAFEQSPLGNFLSKRSQST
ncbi:Noc2p family-domain-containing protein [Phycomyces blakesleeanus]|uniref:Noc2p family-domain-containing protein n=1 Tax=Phycomyces blakesleeanus TaxID=4837 RepID=A0ABR3BFG3_PHYBL